MNKKVAISLLEGYNKGDQSRTKAETDAKKANLSFLTQTENGETIAVGIVEEVDGKRNLLSLTDAAIEDNSDEVTAQDVVKSTEKPVNNS